ncbi:membrane protein insertase YidC [Nocardiopsis sp. NPDC006198]|uniref:Membrane protein insertase YidC n=2 Tax=Nocardiopsidaceae TaxID=83676 RepID=A0ABY6YMN2_9ACTN|nr:membrane protein insertase YidC [Streptomonospora nanhaiensis]MEE2044090.1 membrane protein insertase YidC [Nocardiopsis tropica]WAE73568.1 membrane protein insertase YidC [Streptomonospora nanhaiensis]
MLDWLYNIVGWILVQIHAGLTFVGLDTDSGWAWGLSIVLLTVLMRLLLVPLFVKQMNTQRKMQDIQPKIMKLRERYKHDQQRLQQESMKLYQESGTNPIMGCLPLLLQMPVFFALFSVLRSVAEGNAQYNFTPELVESARQALIFAAPVAAQFNSSPEELTALGATDPIMAKVIIAIACVVMGTTTFLTMRQSMKRSISQMPDNPMMQTQKIMMYMAPLFGLFGLAMPVGVLVYWVTSNVWTMVQQHFLYRNQPVPGQADDKAKGGASPSGSAKGMLGRKKAAESAPEPKEQPKIERKQPKKQPRSKRSGGGSQ